MRNVGAEFEALARLICGGPPHLGFAQILADAAGGIVQAVNAEAEALMASDLLDRSKKVKRASQDLASALHDPSVLGYLDAAGDGPTRLGREVFDLLNDLSARARRAPAVVKIVSGNKPSPKNDALADLRRQGCGSTEPTPENNGLSARETCALVIYQAWLVAKRSGPGVGNTEAWQACNDLWQASEQPMIGKDATDTAPRGWRVHLETAREVLTNHQAETHLHTHARGYMDRLFHSPMHGATPET